MVIEVRVAGLWRREDRLLLARHEQAGQHYWVVPGGRVKPGETLAEALRREFREEAGLDVRVGDVLFVNDFIAADRHVLNIYFAVEPTDPSAEPRPVSEGVLKGVRFVTEGELLNALEVRPSIAEHLLEYLRKGRVERVYLGAR